MPQTYQLTKAELDSLLDMSNFIASEQDRHQRIIDALNLQFKMKITLEVLPRLEIDQKLLDKCVIDVNAGTILIQDEEAEKPHVAEEENK